MSTRIRPRLLWMALMLPLFLALIGPAQAGMFNAPKSRTKDYYKPYRYVSDWTADTLYVGATFKYTGGGPIQVSMKLSETTAGGELYLINPATGEQFHIMSSGSLPGTTVDVSSLTNIPVGSEVVFMFLSVSDPFPRYTGASLEGAKYYNTLNSDDNVNPALRFGHRWSVAGKVSDRLVEFGFEDYGGNDSDMDFNDIVFQATNLDLMVYQNSARKRYYVW